MDLLNKNKKQLLTELTNFEQVWEWGKKETEPKESKPTLTETIKQTITGKKKPPKITAREIQWRNIDLNFTTELIREWESKGFTYQQTKEWIDIGLTPNDADFCVWLRDTKKKDPEWVLNYGNLEQLIKEFTNHD